MNKDNFENRQDEMFSYVELFLQSNVRIKDFCTANGLTQDAFYYWRKKYKIEKLKTNQFLPVEILSGEKERNINKNPDKSILIHYPNGVEIHISEKTSVSIIGSLVKLY